MICFPNTRINIYRLVASDELDPEFHQPITHEEFIGSEMVDFQPVRESDNSFAYGTGGTNTYKLFCEPEADIRMGDTVMIKDEPQRYSVVGVPRVFRNGFIPHMEVLLQLQDNTKNDERM